MQKSYMVIFLPKEGIPDFTSVDYKNEYDEAFDAFNQHLVELNKDQIFKRPKGEKPLRASLQFGDLELWIITRTTDLVTN